MGKLALSPPSLPRAHAHMPRTVGPATKIIKTGQTITVDGNTGVVKILS